MASQSRASLPHAAVLEGHVCLESVHELDIIHRVLQVPSGHGPQVGHLVLKHWRLAAELRLTIDYADQDPVGPYHISMDARRVRQVRFNDLVDPEAIRLGRPFGCVAESQVPVIQLTRQDTRIPGALAVSTPWFSPSRLRKPVADLLINATNPTWIPTVRPRPAAPTR